MLDITLLTGPLPWVLLVLGAAGLVFLLVRRLRWWWTRTVPIVVVGVLALAAFLDWVIDDALHLFPEPVPFIVPAYIAVILGALALMIGWQFGRPRWWQRVVAIVAAVLVAAASANLINQNFQYYPTVGALFGVSNSREVTLPDIATSTTTTNPPGPLVDSFAPPAGMPKTGSISEVTIPGTRSGWGANDGWVYLPPAYDLPGGPALPVLVLIPGQPSVPEDFILAGQVPTLMDEYSRTHKGLAPIVVMPNAIGAPANNPICADTAPLGKLDTYLSVDVPAWIDATLAADKDRRHWAVGGFSYGGTCAIQMATNHPDVYPTFWDVSGQAEPTVGTRTETVDKLFGGDAAAVAASNPIDLLRTRQYPDSAGQFYVGGNDAEFGPGQQTMYEAAKAAGMQVSIEVLPGMGHDWGVPVVALPKALPFLARRMGITS
jgi:S-formylglutathione hydrolase FrmB